MTGQKAEKNQEGAQEATADEEVEFAQSVKTIKSRLDALKGSLEIHSPQGMGAYSTIMHFADLLEKKWEVALNDEKVVHVVAVSFLSDELWERLSEATELALLSANPAEAIRGFNALLGKAGHDLKDATQAIIENNPYDMEHESKLQTVRALHDFASELISLEAASRIQAAVKDAEEGVEHIRQVAGVGAEVELASSFQKYARRHSLVSSRLRIAVVVIAISAVFILVYLLLVSTHKETLSWIELARRAIVTLPAFALAAYLSKESRHHRAAADWAESIEVQLRTISAFTDPLEEIAKNEIRKEFGKRIFMSDFRSMGNDATSGGVADSVAGMPAASGNQQPTQADGALEILRTLATGR